MGLNQYRNEAGNFLNDIGKWDEPISDKLGLLEQELELLKTCLCVSDKMGHQLYDMLFILFEMAAQQSIDLDWEWETGRRRKAAKYASEKFHNGGDR